METETSAMIRIRDLEEKLKAKQIKTSRLEKELAEKKEVIDYWEFHESHIQYQKDLQKFMTPSGFDHDGLEKHARKLLKEQIEITQSYCELYDEWEKERREHNECRSQVSRLQEEKAQLEEKFERLTVSYEQVQDDVEEIQGYGKWFETENKDLKSKLEFCQAKLDKLDVEKEKIAGLEQVVAHLCEQLDIIQGIQPPPPGQD